MKKNDVVFFYGLAHFLFLSSQALSQNREIGLRMSGFGDFDLLYKKQKSEHVFKRYNLAFGNLTAGAVGDSELFQLGLGIGMGKEKRKEIAPKMDFIRGWQYSIYTFLSADAFNYSVSNVNVNGSDGGLLLAPGIGYLIGTNYRINDRFTIGLELVPSVQVVFLLTGEDDNALFLNSEFNTNNIAFTVAYKFNKQ